MSESLSSLLQVPANMPALHVDVQAHGKNVLQCLHERFAESDNWLSYSDYMQFCLYAPGIGYYTSGLHKFGVDGDFVTAPELSPVFGESYADAIAAVLKKNPDWSILELGPGRGKLASALLDRLKTLGALPKKYQLLEVSPSLRAIQKEELKNLSPDIEFNWLDQPPKGFVGIVIANEVIDALAVERFRIVAGEIKQLGVELKNNTLVWSERIADQYFQEQVRALGVLPDDYESEICLQLKYWLQSITRSMQMGILLFSDYGYSQSEYYSSERNAGTLRCHYRQHAHSNSLILPGLQDITAWVNFTQLAEAGYELGLEVMGYCTQAHFLLGSGRLQKIDYSKLSEIEQLNLNQHIKQLTMPSGMGEQFRFMQLNKHYAEGLTAMRVRDLRYQL